MKIHFLDFLLCPNNNCALILKNEELDSEKNIINADLICAECDKAYPTINKIPRFVNNQGYVNNFGLKKTMQLHKSLLNNFLPLKTFLFLLPPKIINERLKNRKKSNKYDKINLEFHEKVMRGYKMIAKNNNRFQKLDANKSIKIIHENIIKSLVLNI